MHESGEGLYEQRAEACPDCGITSISTVVLNCDVMPTVAQRFVVWRGRHKITPKLIMSVQIIIQRLGKHLLLTMILTGKWKFMNFSTLCACFAKIH